MSKRFLATAFVSVMAMGLILFAAIATAESDKAEKNKPDAVPCAADATTEKTEDKHPKPDPKLTPGQVVRIVMDALKKNDAKDSGIAVTFDFASPSNQKVTGPLKRFIPMVKGPVSPPMLNYKSAKYGEVEVKDDLAQQVVTIVDSAGDEAAFVFRLSKQADGDLADCWMTDGVIRIRPGDEPPPLDKPDERKPDKV